MFKGNFVFLRGIEEEDIDLRVKWLNDPIVSKTLNFDYPISKFKTKQWLSRIVSDANRKDFTVCDNSNCQPIGYCGYLSIDWFHRKAEMYGAIGDHQLWGKGIGKDMWMIMVRYAFDYMGLNKIYATAWIENIGMCRINEDCGFKKEGVLRSDVFSHGEYRDRVFFGLIREDYEKDKRQGIQ